MKYYISINCGTQSTKVVIYDENFNCVVQHSTPNEIYYPKPCWAEIDANSFVDSALEGIKQCLIKGRIDPNKVRAICGDGIICGVVGVDEEGNAITPYIPYLDSRAEEEAKWIKENLEPNTYYYWGYIRTGGLCLQWFRDKIMGRPGDSTFYDEVNNKAENVPPGSNGVVFFPYLQGGCNEAANAAGCFLNMTSTADTGVLWREILESIAYEYICFTDKIRNIGVDINNVIFAEGGSKIDVWNQIKSDSLNTKGMTLKRKEGATMADALLAAYAVGDITDI